MNDDTRSITSHTTLQEVILPKDRATLYFERAKYLSSISRGSSIELERQLREIFKSLSFNNDDPQVYMLLAKVYKQNMDISSAMFCYRYVLRLDAGNISATKFLVELLAIKGKELMLVASKANWKSKFNAARCCFDEALELNRENFELWVFKAVCHVRNEEYNEAFEAISKVLRPNRDLPAELYVLRAKINWARGMVEQGNQDIRVAASLDPDHPEVVEYIARSYAKSESLYKKCIQSFKDGKYKEALELVDHAIFLTNEDVKLYLIRSKILRILKDLQASYDAVLKAKALFETKYEEGEFPLHVPSDINLQINLILNEMAIDFAEKGDYEKAILLFNKIIRSEKQQRREQMPPDVVSVNHKYLVNRGDCYRALERLPEAVLDYESAVALQPDDWDIKTKLSLSLYLMATKLFNESRFADAERELSKAVAHNPKVSEYFVLRGKARYYMAHYFDAHADFRKALELDPTNAEVRQRLQQFEDDIPVETTKRVPSNKPRTSHSQQRSRPPRKTETSVTSLIPHEQAKQQSLRKTDKKVLGLSVQDNDLIEMMLHPKDVKQLPPLRLITNDQMEEERKRELARIKQAEAKVAKAIKNRVPVKDLPLQETLPLRVSVSERLLPEITESIRTSLSREQTLRGSPFYQAHVAARKVKVHNIITTHELKETPSIRKGPMWRIFETAKEMNLPKALKKASQKET